jgi:addiction module HigA family antidote
MASTSDHPGAHIRARIIPADLSVKAAAQLLGVGRPALSNLLNGNAALSPEMAAKIAKAFGADAKQLLAMQAAYDAAASAPSTITATVGEYAPRFQQIRANQLEHWADTIPARSRLAVLLRIMVQSAGTQISELDFPGNDDAERPGWDGVVVAEAGSPWVPVGRSGWEFGTNQDPKAKANKDYKKSLKIATEERRQMTFVFVTPRSWPGKTAWRNAQLKENEFKDVRAYDASDLEQWLEQSIIAQAWLSEELGLSTDNVHTPDRLLRIWQADTKPQLPPALFDDILALATRSLLGKLRQEPQGRVVIRADSVEEALGLLAVLFRQDLPEIRQWRDRILFFSEAGVAQRLLSSNTRIVPIAADRAVERAIAIAGAPRSIIIHPKGSMVQNVDLDLGLCEPEAFRKALEGVGCTRDEVSRFARESGLSRTVLRRRLSPSDAISKPDWSRDPATARRLIPLMFAGAWNTAEKEDREIVRTLARSMSDDEIDATVQDFSALSEPPVWMIGSYRGVGSKVDLLHALQEHVTRKDIEDFLLVAEMVLAEDDPAFDLPEDQRWAANIYGKSRSISTALRQGIRESVLLLAVNGPSLFDQRTNLHLSSAVERLISSLLEPLNLRRLEVQSDMLPFYAEAAPEVFLNIIERDLQVPQPIVHGLLRPASSAMFGGCPRTGLLWALETTAWSPTTFRRTIDVLGNLSEVEINDNWSNKPLGSLAAILSSWMPQTTVPLEDRLWAYEHLIDRHADVGWKLCLSQFGMAGSVGHYSHKPLWRPDAAGAGEPLKWVRDIMPTRVKAVELMLTRPRYTKEMLNDLITHAEAASKDYEKRIWAVTEHWAQTADEVDKAWVKERVRRTVGLNKLRTGKRTDVRALSRSTIDKVIEALSPSDLVLRHLWLFEEHWVQDWADEADDANRAYEKRIEKTQTARFAALREIWNCGGLNDVLRLGGLSKAPGVIGDTLFDVLADKRAVRDATKNIIFAHDRVDEVRRQGIASGLLWRMLDTDLQEFLRELLDGDNSEIGFELVLLAPFKAATWAVLDDQPEAVSKRYWREVQVRWLPDEQQSFDRAVQELLNVDRAASVWFAGMWHSKKVQPSQLVRILRSLAAGEGEPLERRRLEAYHLSEAFQTIHASGVLSATELAQLEFAYLEAFEFERYELPGLHQHLRENPQMVADIVSMVYRPDQSNAGDEVVVKAPTDQEKSLAERAYRLLQLLKRAPFVDDRTDDGQKNFLTWLRSARSACAAADREGTGDSTLGQILGRTDEGKDGIWPNENLREALEEISSGQLISGIMIGRLNTRGAEYRRRGGIDDLERAQTYRDWADRLSLRYPKAADVCRQIERNYERDAKWHEERDDIERRVRPW